MQEAKGFIESSYGIRIVGIRPYRAGYILETTTGRKYIKACQYTKERVMFIHQAKTHLLKNNFYHIDPYCLTVGNQPYLEGDESIYTMVNLIDGRECEFDDDRDVLKATEALALMHKASRGFTQGEPPRIPNSLGKLPVFFKKRLEDIRRLRRKAEKERNSFDYLFIENFDDFYETGLKSLDILYSSKYNKLVEAARKEGILCHNDYSYQNILIKNDIVSIINFDYCNIELKIYDIVNMLRRRMRKCNWDIQKARMILDTYRKIEPLDKDEIKVMKSMLLFPQKFWRVVNRYYNSKRSWAQRNFTSVLMDVINEKEAHIKFMKDFDKL
ncbi:MAG: CotS family spore coat protein [Clostridiaceae bacterium]|jgi:CotS family spore coat protein|nr:CotS family spore coat protein [Clostridiaceae bacterium]